MATKPSSEQCIQGRMSSTVTSIGPTDKSTGGRGRRQQQNNSGASSCSSSRRPHKRAANDRKQSSNQHTSARYNGKRKRINCEVALDSTTDSDNHCPMDDAPVAKFFSNQSNQRNKRGRCATSTTAATASSNDNTATNNEVQCRRDGNDSNNQFKSSSPSVTSLDRENNTAAGSCNVDNSNDFIGGQNRTATNNENSHNQTPQKRPSRSRRTVSDTSSSIRSPLSNLPKESEESSSQPNNKATIQQLEDEYHSKRNDPNAQFNILSQIFQLRQQEHTKASCAFKQAQEQHKSTKNKRNREKALKQPREALAEANVHLLTCISFMNECLQKGVGDSMQHDCYKKCLEQVIEATKSGVALCKKSSSIIAKIMDNLFLDVTFHDLAEMRLNSDSSDNEYLSIQQERLKLLVEFFEKGFSPAAAKVFEKKWLELDEKERTAVEKIVAVEDLIVEIVETDEVTGKEKNVSYFVIRKGESWMFHNFGTFGRHVTVNLFKNYHPPPTVNQEDGVPDFNNGCLTAISNRLPNTIQRLNEGHLTEDGRLTESTKADIKDQVAFIDLWSIRPKSKEYYMKEMKHFAKSANIDLIDLEFSGLLQLAGQAVLARLVGKSFRFAVASSIAKMRFNFNGGRASDLVISAVELVHGETLCNPESYLHPRNYTQEQLYRYSLSANAVFAPITSLVTRFDRHSFMVLAQRKEMTDAEKKLLEESRAAVCALGGIGHRKKAFTDSNSDGCDFIYLAERNRVLAVGNKQQTNQFTIGGTAFARTRFHKLTLSDNTDVSSFMKGLALEQKLNEKLEGLENATFEKRITYLKVCGVKGYVEPTSDKNNARKKAFMDSNSDGCVFRYLAERNIVRVIGNKQETLSPTIDGERFVPARFHKLTLSDNVDVSSFEKGLAFEQKLNTMLDGLENATFEKRITCLKVCGVKGYVEPTFDKNYRSKNSIRRNVGKALTDAERKVRKANLCC